MAVDPKTIESAFADYESCLSDYNKIPEDVPANYLVQAMMRSAYQGVLSHLARLQEEFEENNGEALILQSLADWDSFFTNVEFDGKYPPFFNNGRRESPGFIVETGAEKIARKIILREIVERLERDCAAVGVVDHGLMPYHEMFFHVIVSVTPKFKGDISKFFNVDNLVFKYPAFLKIKLKKKLSLSGGNCLHHHI